MKEFCKITLKSLFMKIDIFGYIPTLSIKNQLFYQTFFGGILTLIVIIIGIIATIFFSQELFKKSSPSVNLSSEPLMHPPILNYFNNFEFLIGIQNSEYLTEINEKIFSAKGILFKTIINESGTYNLKSDINLTSCDIALSENKNKEIFSDLNLKGYYCISNIQTEDPYIAEHWGNNGFVMIQIKFVDCDNSTGNCASEEEINNFLHSADLSLYFSDNLVSTRNYKYPFTKILKEQTLKVSESYKVSLIQYLKHIRIESDDGILFTTNHTKNSFTLGEFTHNTVFERDSSTFLSLSIELENTLQKYQRKYYKLQDLAAQSGGIINCCYMIAMIILKYYEKNSYFEYLINNFFEVRLEEFQKTIKIQSYKKNNHHINKASSEKMKNSINNINTNNNNNNTITTNTNTNINSNQNNMKSNNVNINNEKNQNDKKKKIIFSFFDKLILLKLAPKLSRARKDKVDEIFFKGTQYIMNNLDVISFLKRAHAGDMEIKLLMGEEQQKIFEYISKPILSISFLGSRYNLHNLPLKIKKKLLSRNTLFQQINYNDDDSIRTIEHNNNQKKKKKNKNNLNKVKIENDETYLSE